MGHVVARSSWLVGCGLWNPATGQNLAQRCDALRHWFAIPGLRAARRMPQGERLLRFRSPKPQEEPQIPR